MVVRSRIRRAAATHRRAAALAAAADAALRARQPERLGPAHRRSVRDLAGRLSSLAAELAPGWLSAPLESTPPLPVGAAEPARYVRIGLARPPAGVCFPVVAPLGHLAFDADATDPRVAGVLRATMVRALAAAAAGTLLVRAVDPTGVVTGPFAQLQEAGIMPPAATDAAGFGRVLGEAERWVAGPADRRRLLVVIAGWPAAAPPDAAARLVALAASASPRLHLLVAGWGGQGRGATLPYATLVTLSDDGARVSGPTDGRPPDRPGRLGLTAPVRLDDAGDRLVHQVCARLARQRREQRGVTLRDLLPHPPAAGPIVGPAVGAPTGPVVPVGRAGRTPVRLRLGRGSWHWLIGGHAGSGKTALLQVILLGLTAGYDPDEVALYLLDPAGDAFGPDLAGLPHVRDTATDAVRAGEVLRHLAADGGPGTPHTVCLLDNLHLLGGETAEQALRTLAGTGEEAGIHLVVAVAGPPPPAVAAHCRVRIALPGGRVLDPSNRAADGITLGTAVVNTAGGLGGPRGIVRAHEQLVRFPDPYGDPATVERLRRELSRLGGAA